VGLASAQAVLGAEVAKDGSGSREEEKEEYPPIPAFDSLTEPASLSGSLPGEGSAISRPSAEIGTHSPHFVHHLVGQANALRQPAWYYEDFSRQLPAASGLVIESSALSFNIAEENALIRLANDYQGFSEQVAALSGSVVESNSLSFHIAEDALRQLAKDYEDFSKRIAAASGLMVAGAAHPFQIAVIDALGQLVQLEPAMDPAVSASIQSAAGLLGADQFAVAVASLPANINREISMEIASFANSIEATDSARFLAREWEQVLSATNSLICGQQVAIASEALLQQRTYKPDAMRDWSKVFDRAIAPRLDQSVGQVGEISRYLSKASALSSSGVAQLGDFGLMGQGIEMPIEFSPSGQFAGQSMSRGTSATLVASALEIGREAAWAMRAGTSEWMNFTRELIEAGRLLDVRVATQDGVDSMKVARTFEHLQELYMRDARRRAGVGQNVTLQVRARDLEMINRIRLASGEEAWSRKERARRPKRRYVVESITRQKAFQAKVLRPLLRQWLSTMVVPVDRSSLLVLPAAGAARHDWRGLRFLAASS
jgi:hypothetical protein